MQHSSVQMRNRRSKTLVLMLVFLFSLVLIRLVELQVFGGVGFSNLSLQNRIFRQALPLIRGVVLDRYGQLMIANQSHFYRLNNPEKLYSPESKLDWHSALNLMASDSAQVVARYTRYYPFGQSLGQLSGYTQLPHKEDLLLDRQRSINEAIGKTGIEASFEDKLRGQAGQITYEVDALGNILKTLQVESSVPGETLETTADPYLSQVALTALGAKKGVVIILDGSTGEVLSLVSNPSFDPNAFTNPSLTDDEAEQYQLQLQQQINQPDQPFFNRAISGQYPPGSVFKMITALAALESEKVDETTTVNDTGTLQVGEYSYANWYFTQYGQVEGEINLRRAIGRSNDIFFYKAAEWVGPVGLAEMARRFGFGQVSGIELLGEKTGLVPDPDWKQKTLQEPWYLGNTYHFGIGQGDLLVTPIQIARMTQAIANQGVICTPHVLKTAQQSCESLGLSKDNLDLVMAGMLDVCSQGGTAFPLFTHNTIYRDQQLPVYQQLAAGAAACKTGTAEWGGRDGRGFRQTHAWFTMAAGVPIDETDVDVATNSAELVATSSASQPSSTTTPDIVSMSQTQLRQVWLQHLKEKQNFPKTLVITVLVESDGSQPYAEGSRDAAPIAKQILDWVLGSVSD